MHAGRFESEIQVNIGEVMHLRLTVSMSHGRSYAGTRDCTEETWEKLRWRR